MEAPFPLPLVLWHSTKALYLLASGRRNLHQIGPADVLWRNAKASALAKAAPDLLADDFILRSCDRVAFFVPRIARRLPWRADCLVQALAGQQWLMHDGIASEIIVGTTKSVSGLFEAHAWLVHGERIILGGDVARFQPILDSEGARALP